MLHLESIIENQQHRQEQLHELKNSKIRRRCVVCYERNVSEIGTKAAQSETARSTYQCTVCEKKFFVECFFAKHNSFIIIPRLCFSFTVLCSVSYKSISLLQSLTVIITCLLLHHYYFNKVINTIPFFEVLFIRLFTLVHENGF